MKNKMNKLSVEIISPLTAWYRSHKRALPWRDSKDPYRIWVSEIMLQQTRIEAVIPYYFRFLERLPTVADLAAVSDEELNKLWEGLGYYSRAKNLKKAAETIVKEFDGRFPNRHEEILSLAGIGPYTAGAISSIAFDLPTPAVDGNVLRVYSRLTANDTPITDTTFKKRVTANLEEIYPKTGCGDVTEGLMELGERVCLPNGIPLCGDCPLQEFCLARRAGRQSDFPVIPPKAPRKNINMTVFLMVCEDKIALRKRPNSGLLAGLWEFPHIEGHKSKLSVFQYLQQQGFIPQTVEKLQNRTHIFSHIEWHMQPFLVACTGKGQQVEWVTKEELKTAYSLPTAFRRFLKDLP